MKQLFVFLMLLSIVGQSCRTRKEGSYSLDRYKLGAQGQSFIQWHRSDSTVRYWYYQSDNSFYFHPDSGLFGKSGWLAVEETQLERHSSESRQDTSTYLLEEHAVGSYKKESESGSSRLWWYVLGCLFGAFVLFRWRDRFL